MGLVSDIVKQGAYRKYIHIYTYIYIYIFIYYICIYIIVYICVDIYIYDISIHIARNIYI